MRQRYRPSERGPGNQIRRRLSKGLEKRAGNAKNGEPAVRRLDVRSERGNRAVGKARERGVETFKEQRMEFLVPDAGDERAVIYGNIRMHAPIIVRNVCGQIFMVIQESSFGFRFGMPRRKLAPPEWDLREPRISL